MALRIGIREAFRTITRQSSLFLLSLLVTSIALFLLSLFALVTFNLYHFLSFLDAKIEIIAFLEEDAEHQVLISDIKEISGVDTVIYISSDQALAELKKELGETEEVLSVFEDNPLPASLRIKLKPEFRNAQGLEEISKKVMLLPGIKETIYGGEIVDQMKRMTNVITAFDIGLLIIIIFSVIFVIFQTIKLTIFARSTEIEIMKLVGASDTFIATPFTVEGMIQGALGGIIAFILTVITYRIAFSFFSRIFFPYVWLLLGAVACGMLFGIIGSGIALRKFIE